ncbi:extracellular solute-binding protein [Paenibacillus sp. GD4]|uniref:extracellular solute-binding protein n=1 Tax=Paenibacillus sp. GD4 TaxID=3068890 RepID=UPI002796B705|nr:extracellular solute-binding protein [Paenibacillus sp. GD4]MDQ1911997.1 extracellular solute-binding protein [Paenibacillus sp. GD4]
MKQVKKMALMISIVLLCLWLGYRFFQNPSGSQPLKIYVIFQEDEGRILLEKFKETTGQPYELIRMSSGEAAYHLLTLKKSGIDVVLGGPADLHEQLKNNKKSIRHTSPATERIPDRYKDTEGHWTGMYLGPLSIGINQNVWRQDPALARMEPPETYEDLLRPELKGRIEIPDPETSGTGYTLLASLTQERGEERALELMKELKQQSVSTSFSGITSAQRLAVGEVAAVISFLGDQLRFANSGYSTLSIVPPQAGWEIGAVSILKNGSNTNAAKMLVDFVLSSEAQTYYMNTAFSYPVLPDIPLNRMLSPAYLGRLLESYRFDLAARQREQLISKWRSR